MDEKINEVFYNDPIYSAVILKALLTILKRKDNKIINELKRELKIKKSLNDEWIGAAMKKDKEHDMCVYYTPFEKKRALVMIQWSSAESGLHFE